MSFTIRPAVRENTPLIIGIAGPTKSGKTYSCLRLARGLCPDGKIVMLNAEGARGHQYADTFKYLACDITAPFSPERYEEALREIKATKPGCVVVDSASHMHDGPGGLIEYHEAELDRMAGNDQAKRQRVTWAAWIRPKAAENRFIYTMLGMDCPIILAFRAKERLKIIPGRDPINLGWQPIAGDRITFETLFTLVLPPHAKGVPDLEASEMRAPFDKMVPGDKPIDEELGKRLAEWSRGGAAGLTQQPPARVAPSAPADSGQVSTGSPEDDRPRLIAIVESVPESRRHVLCKRLFNDPQIEWRKLDISALQLLASNVNLTRSA